ncbi:M1 family metallopeptidase [Massilia sp. TS11]|uniref:M1 family metallopeptidase n=1 Tax=Massilia sp. TS11 TaxID=2908003 RepID=UPI001EDA9B99|nr:M1 family metallopeptidase [Massilia sp. TS11]MCG2585639.1 M1 family metallopeptidase [Massilia sp. TS11]
MRLTTTVLAASIALACAAHAESPFSFANTPGKLPKQLVPQQYAVHLTPDVANRRFLGAETVEIDVLSPVREIVLNADQLEIDSASLAGKGLSLVLKPELDKDKQLLRFALDKELAPGRYSLSIKWRGQITEDGRGLFRLSYPGGKPMIATNLEPSDARRILPSWDEPAFRARFKLTVDVPANLRAVANMPIEKQEKLDANTQRIRFATTPKMPSYLFVLAVGELERSTTQQDGVEIGVVTTPGKQAQAAFALNSSRDLLRYYNNYFGQNYPLPKLDHIAIPGGFPGAMENWGGIIYNEASILYDPARSPERVKRTSFQVVAHETAHQWFGNLVTMAWWDNLWLNEGFASWMGTKASEHFHPEWRPWLDATAERESVMNQDARKTTHPIQSPVNNEAEAADAFDSITYGKGQAFLRMLENYLGEEAFRRGMRTYMARHQYSNTTTADLWAALEQASGKPVEKLASAWTTQPGFPLLTVSQRCEQGKRVLSFSQEMFRVDGSAPAPLVWPVPVAVGTINGRSQPYLLNDAKGSLVLPSCEGSLVLDPWAVGYYRVQYDAASFAALIQELPKLPDPARLKLLTDSWALVMADRSQLGSYLDLAARYGQEPRLAIWDVLSANFSTLNSLSQGTPENAKVRAAMIKLIKPRFDQLGWDEKPGETVEERELRALLAMALADAGDAATIAEAQRRFSAFRAKPSSVPTSLLDFVVQVAGRHADAATYEALHQLAFASTSTEERNRYFGAMAAARDPALAERSLALLLREDVSATVKLRLLPAIARAQHLDQAWAYATAHKDELMKFVDAVNAPRLFPSVLAGASDSARADQLDAWTQSQLPPEAQTESKRVAAAIRVRAQLKAKLLPQIRTAL